MRFLAFVGIAALSLHGAMAEMMVAESELAVALANQVRREEAAHGDFARWCDSAQDAVSSQLAAHHERMDEASDIIDSFTELGQQLKGEVSKLRGQEDVKEKKEIKLISSASKVWRARLVKGEMEQQIKADDEFLKSVSKACNWEKDSFLQHKAARQQLLETAKKFAKAETTEQPPAQAKAVQTPVKQIKPAVQASTPTQPVASTPAKPVVQTASTAAQPTQPKAPVQPAVAQAPPAPKAPPVLSQAQMNSMSSQALAAQMLDASRMIAGGAPPAQAAPAQTAQAPQDPLMALSQTSWMSPTPAGLSLASSSAPALPQLQPMPQPPLPSLLQQPVQLQQPMQQMQPGQQQPQLQLMQQQQQMQLMQQQQQQQQMQRQQQQQPTQKQTPQKQPMQQLPQKQMPQNQPAQTQLLQQQAPHAAAAKPHVAAPAHAISLMQRPGATRAAFGPPRASLRGPPVPGGAAELNSMLDSREISPEEAQAAAKSDGIHISGISALQTKATEKKLNGTPLQEDPDKALLDIMGGPSSAGDANKPSEMMSPPSAPQPMALLSSGSSTPSFSAPAADPVPSVNSIPPPPQASDPDASLLGIMNNNGYHDAPPAGASLSPPALQSPSMASPLQGSSSSKLEAFPQIPAAPANSDPDSALLDIMKGKSDGGSAARPAMPSLAAFVQQKTGHPQAPAPDMQSLLQTSNTVQEVQGSPDDGTPVDLSSVTVDEWMKIHPKSGSAAQSLAWHPSGDTDSQVSQLLEQVSQISGKNVGAGTPSSPSSGGQQSLSGDLSKLLGLGGKAPAFIQVSQRSKLHGADKVKAMKAASALRAAYGNAGAAGKRLAKVVMSKNAKESMKLLTSLKQGLQSHKATWACTGGKKAAKTEVMHRLTEESVSLIESESKTAIALSGEVKSLVQASTQRRTELVGMLEQTLSTTYAAAGSELHGTKVPKAAESMLLELEGILKRDASKAHELGQELLSSESSSDAEAVKKLEAVHTQKEAELKKQRKELQVVSAAVDTAIKKVGHEKGCAEAAKSAGLLSAVDKALEILKA